MDEGRRAGAEEKRESRWPFRWLAVGLVAAVAAVNAAGVWEIAVARRGIEEYTAEVFRLETATRARAIESALASTRADLAFLTRSPAFAALGGPAGSGGRGNGDSPPRAVGGALLLFLRSHPEVLHVEVRSRRGPLLAAAGRRGGVPVLWRLGSAGGASEAAERPPVGDPSIASAFFEFDSARGPQVGVLALRADVDPARLLAAGRWPADGAAACVLLDAGGRVLASDRAWKDATGIPEGSGRSGLRGLVPADRPREATAGPFTTDAPVAAEGWSAAGDWRLVCVRDRADAAALLEPLASRHRVTLGLNLAVMGLAIVLGAAALQQGRRRAYLEARAREEAKIRELERQLFHAERLGTVGRLAAGMAHEINNPLEGMSNHLILATEALARGESAEAARQLDAVRRGLERAAGIVRQVLAHADPAHAPRVPLDLQGVLRQSLELVRSRPEFGAIRFELDVPARLPEVRGNPVLLGQVLLNLLLNACEAQPAGGEVAVRAFADGGAVRVEIGDRGPGVNPADAARVFEPFYSTKSSTGLGLSICWSIIGAHGGEIGVEPRPGGGAVFFLRLPTAEGRVE